MRSVVPAHEKACSNCARHAGGCRLHAVLGPKLITVAPETDPPAEPFPQQYRGFQVCPLVALEPLVDLAAEQLGALKYTIDGGNQEYLPADHLQWEHTDRTGHEITAAADALCATTTLSTMLGAKGVYKITRNGETSPNGCSGLTDKKLWT